MKLLIATPLYPPELGGPATYARILEQELPKIGIEVEIVKFSDVRHLPKGVSHLAYALRVLRAGRQVDCILSLDAVSVGWPSLFANFFLRKKFVVKMVGDHIWEQGTQRFGMEGALDEAKPFNARQHPYLSFLRILQQITLRSADRIVVPSFYLKSLLASWGIREKNIEVIYNAIEREEGGSVPIAAQAKPAPRIVSIGRLVPWKGMRGLIDAVAMLSADGQNSEVPAAGLPSLIIAGDGPERTALEAYATEKLGERSVFTGAISHADVLALLNETDIFVLNSTYEGLSHVLIEALIAGKAIIATDAGGNSELITYEEQGLLIPPNDTPALAIALKRLLSDAALRERLGAAAAQSGEQFNSASMIEKTAELLRTV